MTKRISVILSVVFLLSACSSSQQVDPLDENLVFDEEQTDLVQDLDFDSEESDDEEFQALDNAEDVKSDTTNPEVVQSDDDFADFDEDSKDSDDFAFDDNSTAKEEADDFDFSGGDSADDNSDFALFDDVETNKPVVSPPLADQDLSFDDGSGFDSPLDVEPSVSETNNDFDLSSKEPTAAGSNEVLSVDYNALQNGGSFVVSTTSTPFYETEFIPETNQYVLKLNNSQISNQLSRPFLTKDFRQSFEAMNSYKGKDESVKFVFQLKPNSFPKVSRVGNRILIEPGLKEEGNTKQNALMTEKEKEISLSATSFEDFLLDKNNYVGQPISLQVKEESVVTIIQFISEQVGANIVISENVKGNISIKLKEVPWDQALISIMKAKGLGYVRSGNILRVATLDELKDESKAANEIQSARKTLAPFHVKVFPLSYAKPQELEAKLKPFLTVAAAGGGATRVGQVISEDRSSSLIVRDTLDVIKSISSLVKELDRPPLQVMIQAKIVEATKTFSKEIQSFLNAEAGNNVAASNPSVLARSTWRGEDESPAFVPEVILGGVNFLGTLTARLRLQELESNVKILSAPSVMAINNQKAVILQNDQIVNVTTVTVDENITQTPEFKDVKLSLEVTPQVSADSNIIMDINVTREFPTPSGNFISVASRSAQTKVIIGNNRTGMIGGIYQVNESRTESGTPYLRKIPLLKWLFNNSSYRKDDTELVIFITPRVIGPESIGGKTAYNKINPKSGSVVSKR
jgi:type IV pilus assembly protein PilQ